MNDDNNLGVLFRKTVNIVALLLLMCQVCPDVSSADYESSELINYTVLDCTSITTTSSESTKRRFIEDDPNEHCTRKCQCLPGTGCEYDTVCNYVTKFILESSHVDEFPARRLRNYGQLNEFVMRDTRIVELEDEPFYNLKNLKYLAINNNALRNVNPSIFRDVPKLETLDLDDNHLVDFTIEDMPHVQKISVKNNELTTVHLRNLPSLTDLYLDGNLLSTFIDSFRELPNVEWLSLGSNSAERLEPNVFLAFTKLISLDLSHNLIYDISFGAFEGLENLRLLDLSNNLLHRIHPAVLVPLTKLEELNLSNNKLKHLDVGKIIAEHPQITNLYIMENNWSCECLYEMLNTSSVRSRTVLNVRSDRDLSLREPGVTNIRGIRCYNGLRRRGRKSREH